MPYVDVPTEQTTAATDGLLALLALAGLVLLWRRRARAPTRAAVWGAALAALAVASGLGAIAHGVPASPGVRRLLWLGIYAGLGLLVALIVVATVYDLRGAGAARRVAPAMVALALLFVAVTQIIDGAFVVFIIYEAAALGFALIGYGYLARRGRLPGAGLVAAGILVTLVAAAIQATRLGAPSPWSGPSITTACFTSSRWRASC